MSERPILFSGPMVRAILDGRKTQTRRLITPQPSGGDGLINVAPGGLWWSWEYGAGSHLTEDRRCPYGVPGDRLWVRETWRATSAGDDDVAKIGYRADESSAWRAIEGERLGPDEIDEWCDCWVGRNGGRWNPSIYMPRWASRLTLRVESVRVERLHDISEADAIAEGCAPTSLPGLCAGDEYRDLWESINAKRAPWASNPWVWVVSFEVGR